MPGTFERMRRKRIFQQARALEAATGKPHVYQYRQPELKHGGFFEAQVGRLVALKRPLQNKGNEVSRQGTMSNMLDAYDALSSAGVRLTPIKSRILAEYPSKWPQMLAKRRGNPPRIVRQATFAVATPAKAEQLRERTIELADIAINASRAGYRLELKPSSLGIIRDRKTNEGRLALMDWHPAMHTRNPQSALEYSLGRMLEYTRDEASHQEAENLRLRLLGLLSTREKELARNGLRVPQVLRKKVEKF